MIVLLWLYNYDLQLCMYSYVCTVITVQFILHSYVCTVMIVSLWVYSYDCTVMYVPLKHNYKHNNIQVYNKENKECHLVK